MLLQWINIFCMQEMCGHWAGHGAHLVDCYPSVHGAWARWFMSDTSAPGR